MRERTGQRPLWAGAARCVWRRHLAIAGWALPQPSAKSGPMPAVVRLSTCPAGRVGRGRPAQVVFMEVPLRASRLVWWPGIACLGLPECLTCCWHRVPRMGGLVTGRTARAICLGGRRLPRAASLFQRRSRTNARGGASNIGGGAVVVELLTSCRAALDGWAPTLAHC